MIGMSLSLCIRDIYNGKVDVDDVDLIFASTRCSCESEWESVCSQYCRTYWRGHEKEAREIFQKINGLGKIYQSRLIDNRPWVPSIAKGCWTTGSWEEIEKIYDK